MSRLVRTCLVSVAVALVAMAGWDLLARAQSIGVDYLINWTAARAFASHSPIYDRAILTELSPTIAGGRPEWLFGSTFTTYISPPTTALLFVPMTWLDFDLALRAYRLLSLIALGGAVWLVALTLPPGTRWIGAMSGFMAILFWTPVRISLALGQLDAWIALALSFSLWCVHTRRWKSAGIGIGMAALLKITPALLIAYCLAKKQWRMAAGSVATALIVIAISLVAGAGQDWRTFLTSVLPALSAASRSLQNQSLPSWMARLGAPDFDLVAADVGLGGYQLLVPLTALAAIALLWRLTRDRPLGARDLGIMVIAALLVGPLSWDHYTAWAILPVVHLGDRYRWAGRTWLECAALTLLLIVAGHAFLQPTIYYPVEAIRGNWWLRVATGTKTVGLILVGFVSLRLLASPLPFRWDRRA